MFFLGGLKNVKSIFSHFENNFGVGVKTCWNLLVSFLSVLINLSLRWFVYLWGGQKFWKCFSQFFSVSVKSKLRKNNFCKSIFGGGVNFFPILLILILRKSNLNNFFLDCYFFLEGEQILMKSKLKNNNVVKSIFWGGRFYSLGWGGSLTPFYLNKFFS